MIQVEGYKAFHGTLLITPTNPKFPPRRVTADWLYKPETNCWYGAGDSIPAEICTVDEMQPYCYGCGAKREGHPEDD